MTARLPSRWRGSWWITFRAKVGTKRSATGRSQMNVTGIEFGDSVLQLTPPLFILTGSMSFWKFKSPDKV